MAVFRIAVGNATRLINSRAAKPHQQQTRYLKPEFPRQVPDAIYRPERRTNECNNEDGFQSEEG